MSTSAIGYINPDVKLYFNIFTVTDHNMYVLQEVSTLQMIHRLLLEIPAMVSHLLTSSGIRNDVTNDALVFELEQFENRLLSASCSVTLTLRAKASDSDSTEVGMPETYSSSTISEIYKAYIFANDGVKLAHFMDGLIAAIQANQSG